MENKDNNTENTSPVRTDIRSSIRNYWEANKDDRDFLLGYIRKNQTGRILFITLAIFLFAAITAGAGFLLSSLIRNGLSHVGYYLYIFVYIFFVLVYWLIYRILFSRMDFRGNTRNARRMLASPIGKETQIREFIDSQKASPKKEDSTKGKHMVRKLIATLLIVILLFTGLYFGYAKFLGPFINYNKGKNCIGKGDHIKAIEYLTRSRGYKNTDELLAQELASYMEQAQKYDSIVKTYNDYVAARDPMVMFITRNIHR
jgi:Ni,Fe-hydrogenase I cytochrome b subunit